MTEKQLTEALMLLTLIQKLSAEERKRFLYMIEGAAVVADTSIRAEDQCRVGSSERPTR